MISLKSFVPFLADYLGLTADALYERQRVLVRTGVLVGPAGRGPGSGVRATPSSVAQLILAVLATNDLSEVDEKVRQLGAGRAEKHVCPLTGADCFAGALELLLSSEVMASKVWWIEVSQSDLKAEIVYGKKGRKNPENSVFGKRPVLRGLHRLSVKAQLPAQAVQEICGRMQQIVGDYPTKALFEQLEATLASRRFLVDD
jgi:hypothetical protein